MLYVQEKAVKLGNVYLGGQVTSVEIQESGSIYVAQDEKGRTRKSQPVGYENARVIIDILLEDTGQATTLDQLTEMQQLFRPYGQGKPRLLPIVNEDCAARGISNVYFKSLSSKKVISESKRIASLELWAPDIAEIQVKKVRTRTGDAGKASGAEGTESKKFKDARPASDSSDQGSAGSVAGAAKGILDVLNGAGWTKSKKSKDKSPAVDSRDSGKAVGAAKGIFDALKGRR